MTMNCPFGYWRHPGGKSNPHAFGIESGAGNHAHCFSCGWSSDTDWMVDVLFNRERVNPSGIKRDFKTAFQCIGDTTFEAPLLQLSATDKSYADEYFEDIGTLHEFPESRREALEPAYFEGLVHPYLAERGISFETASFLDIRLDKLRDRVVFPVRGFDGALYGLHGRALTTPAAGWTAANPKYWAYTYQERSNSQVWLGESWVDFDQPVLVVESVFDLAAVLPIYKNVISPRFTMLTEKQLKRLFGVKVIYTLFDSDKAGSIARQKIAALKGTSITHLSCEPYKDPGEASFDFLSKLLENIEPMDLKTAFPWD